MASIPVPRQVSTTEDLTWQAVDVCERLASAILFVALTPLMAATALAVSLLSGRTPLIAHRRVGLRGSALWMLKFRTMWRSGAPARCNQRSRWVEYILDDSGPQSKQAIDPRVTNSFARFCRKHSIDEIPQLWHVIRGEMSLVGPRPVTATEIRQHYGPQAGEVLQVKPGIAGLWQISGRNRLSYSERRGLDLHYVRHRSLGMYLRILLRTIPEVCSGSNTW